MTDTSSKATNTELLAQLDVSLGLTRKLVSSWVPGLKADFVPVKARIEPDRPARLGLGANASAKTKEDRLKKQLASKANQKEFQHVEGGSSESEEESRTTIKRRKSFLDEALERKQKSKRSKVKR